MTHHFSVGDEVVIRSTKFNGRHGVITELQKAFVYRLDVTGVDELLFFSEECLVSPGEMQEEQEHLDRSDVDVGMAVMRRPERSIQTDAVPGEERDE